MLEINVTVNCPDLLAASQVLATAMAGIAAKKQPEPAAPAMGPSTAPAVPTGQNPAGSAVGASPASTIPSNVVPMAAPVGHGYGPGPAVIQVPGPMTPPPVAPVQSIPVGQPAQAPINPVPTTTAPGFTQAQIAKVGADLITADPGKRQALNALLYQYGVRTLSQIPPEHYGAVATALRGMGANI